MKQKLFTENEIIVCTHIARFGYGYYNEKRISKLENRSESSIKMKVQNIAAMLKEEGLPYDPEINCLSGVTRGASGRRTNWDTVGQLVNLTEKELRIMCREIFAQSSV